MLRSFSRKIMQSTSGTTTTTIQQNLIKVRETVERLSAQVPGGRPVTLVAVSKTKSVEDIMQAYQAGQRHFGENYVQELVDKSAQLPKDIQWHFIGHAQSNKCKLLAAVPNLYVIETVDSTKKAEVLEKACLSVQRPERLRVFLQVNTSGEDAKNGMEPDTCVHVAQHILANCPHLQLGGLMTIGSAEISRSDASDNPDFQKLVACRDQVEQALQQQLNAPLELSMGMSAGASEVISIEIQAPLDRLRTGDSHGKHQCAGWKYHLWQSIMISFLVRFTHEHVGFRLAELQSLLDLFRIKAEYDPIKDYSPQSAYLVLKLPSWSDAARVAERAMLIKDISEIWGQADAFPELVDQVKQVGNERIAALGIGNVSWRFDVITFAGSRGDLKTQRSRMNQFGFLDLKGVVDLQQPEMEMVLCEFYELPEHRTQPFARHFMGIKVASSPRFDLLQKYDLKKRRYLGITSMDAELSLIMANMALVRPGSLVLDPFAGTGSFLYTCSEFGAYTMGNDVDGRQLRGTVKYRSPILSDDEVVNIATNCVDYSVEQRVLDLMTCDISHAPWREGEFFDAIVTDPPYGVRAGAKKIGSSSSETAILRPDERGVVPPKLDDYELDELALDLLKFCARHLKVGGRLVYWLPVITGEDSDELIPKHPQLRIVAHSLQSFGKWSRRMITMEKVHGDQSKDEGVASLTLKDFRKKYFTPTSVLMTK